MSDRDIKNLIKILGHKKRDDLVRLLDGSNGEIELTGQFGSKWNSTISTYIIFAPLKNYYLLKQLPKKDIQFILESIHDMHPVADGLPEIISVEFRMQLGSSDEVKQMDEIQTAISEYVGRTSRVFISYSTKDKVIAGKVKDQLEIFGLEVFLAHEDINPSSEWQDAILDNLDSTDIFMPIVSDNFKRSKWTDQESGIAFAKNKFILPISIEGCMPYGFLGKYQAFKLRVDTVGLFDFRREIIDAIIQAKPKFVSQLLDSLIKSFVASRSFDDAGVKSELLLKFDSISKVQLRKIFLGLSNNSQINCSWRAQKSLKKLFLKHRTLVDQDIKEGLIEIFNEDIFSDPNQESSGLTTP